MAVKVGSFTKTTSGAPASQAVTGLGFEPKALILWTVGATSTGAWNDNYTAAIGFCAGASSVGSISSASQDNQDTSNTSRRMASKALTIVQWGETLLAECDLTSFDSDGFTLSWTTNDAVAYRIHYMALGGSDLTNAVVLPWQLSTSTGNQAVTGVGFQPDCVLHISTGSSSALPVSEANAHLVIGAMDANSQWSSVVRAQDAQGTTSTSKGQFDNAALLGALTNGLTNFVATFVSFDEDGFTIDLSDAPVAASRVFSLCLKGGSYDVGLVTLSSVGSPPSDQSVTGVGFLPEGVMVLANNATKQGGPGTSLSTDLHWHIGASDGTTQGSQLASDDYLQGTSNTGGYVSTAKLLLVDIASDLDVDQEGTVASLDADGFTVTKNPWANSVSMVYFAFSGGSAAVTHALAGSAASTSVGTADLHIDMALTASGASVSDGSAIAVDIGPGDLRVTQAGAQIDVQREVPVDLTQAGAQIDVRREVPVDLTQAGAQIDVQRTVPVDLTQAGAGIDAYGQTVNITQAGVQIDARYERPVVDLNCWEFHVEDFIGNYLAYLDNAFNKAYLEQLSDLGGGSFDIPADDSKATAANLTIGNVVKVRYRNVEVGAFLIEQVNKPLVGSGEEAEHIISVSGRGLMATLEKGIVYPTDINDPTTTEREFSGVTKAAVFKTLYQEFEARGGGELTAGFNAVTDSRNVAWTDTVTMKFQAGQKLVDVLRQLAGLGLEVTADPDRTLQAWVSAGTDQSSAVVFRQGLNIMQAAHSSDGVDLANAVVGEGENILVESTDATSIAARGRKETYLPLRNTSDTTQVTAANQLLLNQFADPVDSYTLVVNADVLFPLFDYDLGDTVRVEIPGEVSGDYRVKSIGIRERSGPCDLEVTLELNSLRREYLIRLQRSLESNLTNPSGAGVAANLANTGTTVTNTATNLADNAIKDVHIDWGTGAQQVSAADVPIADAGGYYAVDDVESALGELGPLLSANEVLQHVTTGTTYLAAGYPVIYCTSPVTINLPAAATVNNRVYHVVNAGTGLVTIDPNAGELINGTTTMSVAGTAAAMIHCNGTAWWTIA